MLAEQRQNRVLQIINKQGFAEVENLAADLNVSLMTIRRDLQNLSRQGLINRQHGGATALVPVRGEIDYSFKKTSNRDSKKKIAETALRYIHDGDTLFLDSGTTTYEIALLLAGRKGLTVLTNDITMTAELLKYEVELILIGGIVQKQTGSISGQPAIEFIQQFRISTAFIGAASIDYEFNVMTPTIEKAYLKREVLKIATQTFLVADASKFYGHSLSKICRLSDLTGVITDKAFSAHETEKMEARNINVIPAE